MKAHELSGALALLDNNGSWIFPTAALRTMFPHESERAFFASMEIHASRKRPGGVTALIGRISKGVWYLPWSRHIPDDALLSAVPFIRPFDFNYLSLESVLSEAGVISQMPSARTLMSTGRTQRFTTPLGSLEFVHCGRADVRNDPDVQVVQGYPVPVATPRRAYLDLKRVRRSLDLVPAPDAAQLLATPAIPPMKLPACKEYA